MSDQPVVVLDKVGERLLQDVGADLEVGKRIQHFAILKTNLGLKKCANLALQTFKLCSNGST
jgi:hypothetical protein